MELVTRSRDAGFETALIERPMPDAMSVAGIGRAFDLVAVDGGVRLEAADGEILDRLQRDNPLAAAAEVWSRFCSRFEVPGRTQAVRPIAIGGFAFRADRTPGGSWSGFPALLLRIPRLSVIRVRGRTYACACGDGAEELLGVAGDGYSAPPARRLEVVPVQDPRAWVRSVDAARRRLGADGIEKVVLAREIVAHADGAVAAGSVLRALRSAYPSCFTYFIAGGDGTALAGASPELLARRRGSIVASQPMAGSVGRGHNEAEDELLAALVAGSDKDLAEHAVVVRHVRNGLEALGGRVSAGAPEVVRFTNIQHLATTIRAELPGPAPADVMTVCAQLHPTPAVGGAPSAEALHLIDELENIERGWYAGGVGWVDAAGDGEFAVALRCGLLWEDGARLYAGVGVMPDSDPEAELAETELKFNALLGALVS